MAQIQIKKVTNANVYVNGNSLLGAAEEINVPEMQISMSEVKAVGLVGKVELPSGVEKMELAIKWNSYYPDTLKQVSNPFKAVPLQIRGSLETYDSAGLQTEQPVVIYCNGFAKSGFPGGAFKQNDNVEASTKFSVTSLKMEVAGVPVVEFDAFSNTWKVDNVDILKNYRQNIGS